MRAHARVERNEFQGRRDREGERKGIISRKRERDGEREREKRRREREKEEKERVREGREGEE